QRSKSGVSTSIREIGQASPQNSRNLPSPNRRLRARTPTAGGYQFRTSPRRMARSRRVSCGVPRSATLGSRDQSRRCSVVPRRRTGLAGRRNAGRPEPPRPTTRIHGLNPPERRAPWLTRRVNVSDPGCPHFLNRLGPLRAAQRSRVPASRSRFLFPASPARRARGPSESPRRRQAPLLLGKFQLPQPAEHGLAVAHHQERGVEPKSGGTGLG